MSLENLTIWEIITIIGPIALFAMETVVFILKKRNGIFSVISIFGGLFFFGVFSLIFPISLIYLFISALFYNEFDALGYTFLYLIYWIMSFTTMFLGILGFIRKNIESPQKFEPESGNDEKKVDCTDNPSENFIGSSERKEK